MDIDIPFSFLVFVLLSWRLNHCGGPRKVVPEIVMPRYLAEGTDSKTVPWSMYLVWMGHLAFVICRTWPLDGLKLMSHRFSHISRVWMSYCRVTDSPSELVARYVAVSSAKSLTLDLTWSGRSFIYVPNHGKETETQMLWPHLKIFWHGEDNSAEDSKRNKKERKT